MIEVIKNNWRVALQRESRELITIGLVFNYKKMF